MRRDPHAGFGERPGETDREQSRNRAPGRLNHVEQSFRMSKSDVAARPIHHRLKDSIEAHLTIVFTALAVARDLQARSGWSLKKIVRGLRPLQQVTIQLGGQRLDAEPAIPDDIAELLTALHRGH